MTNRKTMQITRMICLAGLTLALLVGATSANAQSREGRWDFTIGTPIQLGGTFDFEGGSTVKTGDDWGFALTTGYNLSDNLETSFGLRWAGVSYDANVVKDDGGVTGISGTYDVWGLSGNLIYNFGRGPLTPFVGAGIGWAWIDSNVPNGLPSTGCYWDPWYGYICYTDYPTKTTDAFTYQGMLGLRYAFNPTTFLRLSYISQWMSLDQATTTPRFDVIGLEIGWMF